ncbi:MAG: glycosyltransferase, partial [Pseudomonadota bacterium]
MRAPYFSIITVTKNNFEGLKQTAFSIDAQRHEEWSDFEWIVIDGNSEDGTQDFLKKTKALWFSQPDHGLYDAMNKGLDRANGIYVLFMNAGDIFADNNTLEVI